MKHTKKIEMVEIRYKTRMPEKALELAKDLLEFGVDVELTADVCGGSFEYDDAPFGTGVEYILTATCSKGIWMSVLLHRKK